MKLYLDRNQMSISPTECGVILESAEGQKVTLSWEVVQGIVDVWQRDQEYERSKPRP